MIVRNVAEVTLDVCVERGIHDDRIDQQQPLETRALRRRSLHDRVAAHRMADTDDPFEVEHGDEGREIFAE